MSPLESQPKGLSLYMIGSFMVIDESPYIMGSLAACIRPMFFFLIGVRAVCQSKVAFGEDLVSCQLDYLWPPFKSPHTFDNRDS